MRTFLAIDIPESMKDRFQEIIQQCVQYQTRNIKPTSSHQMHLTLRFLGDISDDTARKITDYLEKSRFSVAPLHILSVGGFPDIFFPTTLWFGLENNPSLHEVYDTLDAGLKTLGIPPEPRKYFPHITFLRLKTSPNTELVKYISSLKDEDWGIFQPEYLTFYKSTLSAQGSEYTILKRIHLIPSEESNLFPG